MPAAAERRLVRHRLCALPVDLVGEIGDEGGKVEVLAPTLFQLMFALTAE